MAYSEAQRRATNAYRRKHKERTNYIAGRSSARSFIRKRATLDDLDDLAALIDTRREELQKKIKLLCKKDCNSLYMLYNIIVVK